MSILSLTFGFDTNIGEDPPARIREGNDSCLLCFVPGEK
jgi:hypothetical protein